MKRNGLISLAFLVAACSPAPDSSVVEWSVAGRYEQASEADGPQLPRVVRDSITLSLCARAEAAIDSSTWVAQLQRNGEAQAQPAPPHRRYGNTLCWDAPIDATIGDGVVEWCAELEDRFDGSSPGRYCQALRIDRAAADKWNPLNDAVRTTLRAGLEPQALQQRLAALELQANAAGFGSLASRIRLIQVYFLRRIGDDASRQQAERLLAPPDWVEEPQAATWRAQYAYERALIEEARGNFAAAWLLLERAEAAYAHVLDGRGIAVTARQAGLLARVGAVREAWKRLAAALERCAVTDCRDELVASSSITLAWLILSDGGAREQELGRAVDSLQAIVRSNADNDAFDAGELANAWINLAYAQVRRGDDAERSLLRAAQALEQDGESPRGSDLNLLLDLIRGEAALRNGDWHDAGALCGPVADAASSMRLQAWAVGCSAQAQVGLGELQRADDQFDRALLLHSHADAATLGQRVPMGPGRRAVDFFRSARVALELNRPDGAWQRLDALDRLASRDACVVDDAEIAQLRVELAELSREQQGPAHAARRLQNRETRHRLAGRLQDRLRRLRCESWDPAPLLGGFRAFAVDDEVIVLRRHEGRTHLYRRTPLRSEALRTAIDRIEAGLEAGPDRAASWTEVTEVLSRALAPAATDLGEQTVYAAHGELQRIPLNALQIADGRFLAEATVLISAPVGSDASATTASSAGAPLFVVDPTGTLSGRSRQVERYRGLFPQARLLSGDRATAEAFRLAAGQAGWVHIDSHARFDPAFPENSSIELADGALSALELTRNADGLGFVNLSCCRTGRWPSTVDRGHFGLAGHLARSGVDWIVASRNRLDDAVAREFNRRFYEAWTDGHSLPAAYGLALRGVADRHDPWLWAPLLLVQGGSSAAAIDGLEQRASRGEAT